MEMHLAFSLIQFTLWAVALLVGLVWLVVQKQYKISWRAKLFPVIVLPLALVYIAVDVGARQNSLDRQAFDAPSPLVLERPTAEEKKTNETIRLTEDRFKDKLQLLRNSNNDSN